MLEIKFYHKSNCRKCDFVKRRLDKFGESHSGYKLTDIFVDVENGDKTLEYLKNQGYFSFPVVQLWDDADIKDSFCDLDIGGLNRIESQVS
ncbi:orf74 [Lactobacillus phage LP65]|uniref:Orf74 n=1 Tax=Lactobacillus phage LP65 TaxID=2892344 RepID=Q5ULP0_9CAUD|nr:hypothetical protein LP65_gp074 [Lactobacillus phage LP65]AAV35894.1 orf74 [Lactobacillus phage LP65]